MNHPAQPAPEGAKLALGSSAWLRHEADDREEMLYAISDADAEENRETKREILGLRDAATELDKLRARCERLEGALDTITTAAESAREAMRSLNALANMNSEIRDIIRTVGNKLNDNAREARAALAQLKEGAP